MYPENPDRTRVIVGSTACCVTSSRRFLLTTAPNDRVFRGTAKGWCSNVCADSAIAARALQQQQQQQHALASDIDICSCCCCCLKRACCYSRVGAYITTIDCSNVCADSAIAARAYITTLVMFSYYFTLLSSDQSGLMYTTS